MTQMNSPNSVTATDVSIDASGENITISLSDGSTTTLKTADAFQRLNQLNVSNRFGEDVASILSTQNVMASLLVFTEMAKQLPNNDKLSRNPICYWNSADSTVDFLQPFYFVPPASVPYGVKVPPAASSIFFSSVLYEPDARRRALKNKQTDPDQAISTLDQVGVYQATVDSEIDYRAMSVSAFQDTGFRKNYVQKTSTCFGLSEGFIELIVNEEIYDNADGYKLIFSNNPQVPGSPRWGFFSYKISLKDLAFVANNRLSNSIPFLNLKDANQLVQTTQGTPFGADKVHEFLSSLVEIDVNNKKVSEIEFSRFEDRLQTLARLANKFDVSMRKGNDTTIYTGATEEKSSEQKPWKQQLDNVKKIPIFVKTASIYGTATTSALRQIEGVALTLNIHTPENKPKYISSIKIDNTVKTPKSLLTLTLQNSIFNKTETFFLEGGKLTLIEQELVSQISQALESITDFNATLKDSLKILEPKANNPTAKDLSDVEFIFASSPPSDRVKNATVYFLANLTREAVENNELYIEQTANKKVRRSKLVKTPKGKRRKSVTNFNNLAGPWTLGYVAGKKVVYQPEWEKLLAQFTWLNTDSQKILDFDYQILQINRYPHDSNDITSKIGAPELSFVLATDDDNYDVRVAPTYKTFFDKIYKYPIYYKEKAISEKIADLKDVVSGNLTQEDKEKIVRSLSQRKNELVEQAFGETGCVEAALKTVQTIEDLYDNVLHKGNWALFVAQTVDRFKCEISKLGGEPLECLASFDAVGSYERSLRAIDVVQNFPEYLKKEAEGNPEFPLANLIFNREIPKVPSLDWYKCLRGFLISLLIKIVSDLIVVFVRSILDSLNIECGADFSSCEQSEIDSKSSSSNESITQRQGLIVASGLRGTRLVGTTEQIRVVTGALSSVTPDQLSQFLSLLAQKMPLSHFKALLSGDSPEFIFSNGYAIASDFFYPTTFTKGDFSNMLSILNDNYNYEALLAGTLFNRVLAPDECPPSLVDGDEELEDLLDKTFAQVTLEDKDRAIAEAKNRASAFCELLNGTVGLINEINTAPTLLAGFTNFALSGAITQLITQLRVKPVLDYRTLRRLFVGTLDDKPSLEDVVTADLSLAYNVLYNNYYLSPVLNEDNEPLNSQYEKKFNLFLPNEKFKDSNEIITRINTVLRNDTFKKEVAQDFLNLFKAINPFITDEIFEQVEASLFGVFGGARLNNFERNFLEASRELNNPNYFYSWLEDLLSNIVEPDPRTFPAKYQEFVSQEYPNAVQTTPDSVPTPLESSYQYEKIVEDGNIIYRFSNTNNTLIEAILTSDKMTISINGGEKTYSRDLPKLSEPFLVEEQYDYKEFVEDNSLYWEITATNEPAPFDEKIFQALAYKSLSKYGLTQPSGFAFSTGGLVKKTYLGIADLVGSSTDQALAEGNETPIANFFFGPYLQPLPTDITADTVTAAAINTALKNIQNPPGGASLELAIPPSALFFRRADNIISDVFFEDTVEAEVEKILEKVKVSLASFYKNLSDGELNEPRRLQSTLGNYVEDPEVFYEVERLLGTTKYLTKDWMSSKVLSPADQASILGAIKEVTGE